MLPAELLSFAARSDLALALVAKDHSAHFVGKALNLVWLVGSAEPLHKVHELTRLVFLNFPLSASEFRLWRSHEISMH